MQKKNAVISTQEPDQEEYTISVADRLTTISDALYGMAQVLDAMYFYEMRVGEKEEDAYLEVLSETMEKQSFELRKLTKEFPDAQTH